MGKHSLIDLNEKTGVYSILLHDTRFPDVINTHGSGCLHIYYFLF